jgi:hypothetical protein
MKSSAKFVRAAVRTAIREAEEARTRRAYLETPEAEPPGDDWSNAGAWTT